MKLMKFRFKIFYPVIPELHLSDFDHYADSPVVNNEVAFVIYALTSKHALRIARRMGLRGRFVREAMVAFVDQEFKQLEVK